MIINRKDIAKNVSKNYAEPASGPFNHRLKSLEKEEIQSQDIKRAKELLAQEGYSKSHPLKLNMVTYDGRPELPKIDRRYNLKLKRQMLIYNYAM